MQLLRMGTLLIRHVPDALVRHRKELIKFGWNHLKSEDGGAKQFAFVNVCHFLEAYQAPEKMRAPGFRAGCACQPESKDLVRQALNALTPALPSVCRRPLPQVPNLDPVHAKILVEEAHSLRTPDPRLEPDRVARVALLPEPSAVHQQMVNSRRGRGVGSSPAENGALSVDLVELELNGGRRRARGVSPSPKPNDKEKDENEDEDEEGEDEAKTQRRRRRNASGPSGRAASIAYRRQRNQGEGEAIRPMRRRPRRAPPRRRRRMRRRMIRKTPSCPPPRRRTRTWRWATRTTSTWATPPTRSCRTEAQRTPR